MRDNQLVYVKKPDDDFIFLRDVLIKEWGLSGSLLGKLKQQHKIKVNGHWTLTNYKMRIGDLITVDLELDEENLITPRELILDIIYEDQDYLIVNKPPHLAVHPTRNPHETTLAHGIAYYWAKQGNSSLFRPINRLDKDTSGLVLVGKSQYAHQAIFRQMKQGNVERSYQALVEGIVEEDSGRIDLPIAHLEPENSPKRSVSPAGKNAVTYFTVLKRWAGFSWISLTLGSGRTHQIRVHMSHIGHPLCGDALYGSPSSLIPRQALHAQKLFFVQPRTGIRLELQAPLPSDIVELLEGLSSS